MNKTAIETLMSEHRQIEKILFCLEKYVSDLHTPSKIDPRDLERFVNFIQQYADRLHHLKEEDLLFVMMGQHGFPIDEGPISVMLYDHEQGRRYVQILAHYAKDSAKNSNKDWLPEDLEKITKAARAFSQMLVQHIQKEDQILYPLAIRVLPSEDMEKLNKSFLSFQFEKSEDIQKYEKVFDDLFLKYGTGFQEPSLVINGCC